MSVQWDSQHELVLHCMQAEKRRENDQMIKHVLRQYNAQGPFAGPVWLRAAAELLTTIVGCLTQMACRSRIFEIFLVKWIQLIGTSLPILRCNAFA